MTRLFLRFYLGVIVILLLAWQIQEYVYAQQSADQNARVVEHALGGGARLAKRRMLESPPERARQTLTELSDEFGYPVQYFKLSDSWVTDQVRKRLRRGDVVLLDRYISIALSDDAGLLLGELPQFVRPSTTVVNFGLGTIFILTAIAIAVLLRPVALQLRAVERTAAAIAAGDFSARIDTVPSGFPLVQAFNTMADRQETLLQSQRELLQAVSHELRTPLARLHFATDLIASASTPEERNMRLATVNNATQELDELVGELLTYVRIESEAAPTIERLGQRSGAIVSRHRLSN
jgi:two-component system, OmpR family, sensor histidine kinase RstB